jgi:hypothetical protein
MIETHVLNQSVKEIPSTTQPIETAHKSPQMLQELLTSAVVQLETELQDKLEKLLSKQEYQLLKIGENINSLTQELEQAISEFLQIAQQANKTYSSLQFLGQFVEQKPNNSLNKGSQDTVRVVYSHAAKLPLPVVEKYGLGFILKDKMVDLSQLGLTLSLSRQSPSLPAIKQG